MELPKSESWDEMASLSTLPLEVFLKLISLLDDRSLYECGRVCKEWNWFVCTMFVERGLHTTEIMCDNVNAIKQFSAAIALNGYNNPALIYFHRGTCYYREEETEIAVQNLQKAISLAPPGSDYHVYNAVRCQIQSDFLGAVSESAQAIEIDPKNATAWYIRGFNKYDLQDYKGSLEDLTHCLELKYPYKWKVYNSRGWCYRVTGETDKAIEDFSMSGRLNVRYTKAFINKCTLINKKKRPPNVEDEVFLTEFLKNTKETNLGGVYFTRAAVRYELKDYTGAIEDYRSALAAKYHSPHKCHIGAALCYEHLSQYAQAEIEYETVVKMRPSLASVAIESRAEAKLNVDYEGCIADCKLAIATNPKNLSFAFRYLAAYQADCEDYDGAIETITNGLKANPFNNAMLILRAAFYTFRGNYKMALQDYDSSLKDRPDSPEVWKLRANLKFAMADLKGAHSDYLKSKVVGEDEDLGTANNLGVLLMIMGKYDESRECFNQAMKLTSTIAANEILAEQDLKMLIRENLRLLDTFTVTKRLDAAFVRDFNDALFLDLDLGFEGNVEREIKKVSLVEFLLRQR